MTASFESILIFAGFTLGVSTFVTVLGLFVLRITQPQLERPYRVAGYPLTPLIFLLITGWTLIYIVVQRPTEGLWGMCIIAVGVGFYGLSQRFGRVPKGSDA